MISWIARSVSKSTADVAVITHVIRYQGGRTHKRTFVKNKHLGLSSHTGVSGALAAKSQAALTFLNNARAKHSNCLCPADKDDPPS